MRTTKAQDHAAVTAGLDEGLSLREASEQQAKRRGATWQAVRAGFYSVERPGRRPRQQLKVGEKYGRWTVIGPLMVPGRQMSICVCDCSPDIQHAVGTSSLRLGRSISCGCYRRERLRKHGKSRTPEYQLLINAINRCYNLNNSGYADYGGRDIPITVCSRWYSDGKANPINFLEDMGSKPPGMSLHRIDPDGNYEPGNCKWATREEQNAPENKRLRITVTEKQRSVLYKLLLAASTKSPILLEEDEVALAAGLISKFTK